MHDTIADLDFPELGSREAVAHLPVAHLGRPQSFGAVFQNCFMQELIAPRVTGAMLNIGAGSITNDYRQPEMFDASEYHTQEIGAANVPATYICDDAANIPDAPDNKYDFVMSFSVLEHCPDPWAVAREKIRVTKPGGLILTKVPFSCVLHRGQDFGDLWRFTPQGLMQLFKGCELAEIVLFGDDPRLPTNIWTIVRKGGRVTRPRYYWFDMPNTATWDTLFLDEHSQHQFEVYELLLDPMSLGYQLNQIKDSLAHNNRLNVPQKSLARDLVWQFARFHGRLGWKGTKSFFSRP